MRQNNNIKSLQDFKVEMKQYLLRIVECDLDQFFLNVLTKNPKLLESFREFNPNVKSKNIDSICYMRAAVKINNPIILKHILENGGKDLLFSDQFSSRDDDPEQKRSFSSGVLHTAAKYNSLECLKVLDSYRNYLLINSLDAQGYTALHHSAENGQLDSLKYLIEMGVGINIKTYDIHKNTSLHLAAKNGQTTCVEFLISKDVQIYHQNSQNKTAYRLALDYEKSDCADLIKEAMEKNNIPLDGRPNGPKGYLI